MSIKRSMSTKRSMSIKRSMSVKGAEEEDIEAAINEFEDVEDYDYTTCQLIRKITSIYTRPELFIIFLGLLIAILNANSEGVVILFNSYSLYLLVKGVSVSVREMFKTGPKRKAFLLIVLNQTGPILADHQNITCQDCAISRRNNVKNNNIIRNN
ncbi:23826_t:CDS:2 [Dentiscutata erythropus]|uniref:23826_t:CDS:1 n=1 Tax=Dentiscutata erythropus TaxID=1348616 RepID=A0A9N9FWA2_9GLOM|nr:23826_t:CDS:2 [Dentiscutata erythropus]